ncbi:Hypothetical protein PHPALM_13310 [Phytophthora palmivora]|uniref:MULE transposase domain-containing protein n=1 Tax=Phytophthora palmivora TaxID=4796 RepID=A0A2P4XXI4_9STRA|nr:Hypothetical protein PHPALM_13310 [Phytophthora palmivora]
MYHGLSIFIDRTFRYVPRTFKQMVPLHVTPLQMVHEQASELHLPVYFVLCTGKNGDMYFDILELIFRDTSEELLLAEIVWDFEQPVIDAAQRQFPNADIIGCLLHLKQTIRRHMKQRDHIPEEGIRVDMQPGGSRHAHGR